MDSANLSRRDFLKKAGKVALGGAAAISFGSLTGCATFPKDTREDVDKINWNCNPILPIPKKGGIYIGTNIQTFGGGVPAVAEYFKHRYGKAPTFTAPGRGYHFSNDGNFPKHTINFAHAAGVIPMIRYIVLPKSGTWLETGKYKGFQDINRGLKDDDIKMYGAEAAKLEHPIIVCPFQQVNTFKGSGHRGYDGPGTAGPFKEAYVRIHDIWKQEGALDKVLMGPKLLVGRFEHWEFQDPLRFIPPEETVDIIGYMVNNSCKPRLYIHNMSFEQFFKYDYTRTVDKYPNKPQFLWEIACDVKCNQAAWYDDALTKIEEKYHWVKAVNLDENTYPPIDMDPAPNEATARVIRKHFENPRYIGNILPQKDL